MANNQRIARLIEESGYTKKHVAKNLGITRQALANKLHGKIRWSAEDMYNVKNLFGLTAEEAFDIFLPEK